MSNTAPALPDNVEASARAVVSRNIRIAMAQKGVPTSGTLADELGVDRRWVSRRLAGEFDYTLADLIRLAAALDVSVVFLVREVGE